MLSGIKIKTEKDIRNTASKIQELGAKNVIVKEVILEMTMRR